LSGFNSTYRNISIELRNCFTNNRYFKQLMNWDSVLVFGGLAVLIMNLLTGFGSGFGGLIATVGNWSFLVGLLITYAKLNHTFLYVGLFTYAALRFIKFVISIPTADFSFSPLFSAIVFGWLGYMVFSQNNVTKADISRRK